MGAGLRHGSGAQARGEAQAWGRAQARGGAQAWGQGSGTGRGARSVQWMDKEGASILPGVSPQTDRPHSGLPWAPATARTSLKAGHRVGRGVAEINEEGVLRGCPSSPAGALGVPASASSGPSGPGTWGPSVSPELLRLSPRSG